MRTIEVMTVASSWPGIMLVQACGWDLGDLVGSGKTIEQAMEDFKDSWSIRYDEDIEVKLIEI